MANQRRPKPKRLRVGYLLHMYPRFSQTFILNEILELQRLGVDVRIVALERPTEGRFQERLARVRHAASYLPETWTGSFRKTRRLHTSLMRRAGGDYARAVRFVVGRRRAMWRDLLQAGFLLRWAEKTGIDHLHVHDFRTREGTVALLAHKIGGLRYSLALHAGEMLRADIDRPLQQARVDAAAFTVVNTEFNRRHLLDTLPCPDAEKIRLLYNGVDLREFSLADPVGRNRTVLAAGRLVEKKGFVFLVRALRRLRDGGCLVPCRIIGDGPQRERLLEEIRGADLSEQVRMSHPSSQRKVRHLMRTCGRLVVPSVSVREGNMDGIPNVVLEAMAVGCPVIGSRLSGIPEVIEDGVTGLLVDPTDDVALADAIRTLVTDRSRAADLGAHARQFVEQRFSLEHNVGVLRDWFTSAGA